MAEKLVWKSDYEVGYQVIDDQHKKLVELAGDLYDATTGSPDNYKASLDAVLKGLTDYTVYHFSTEEGFMDKLSYPDAASHKGAHKEFIAELESQAKNLDSGSIEDGVKFYEYIGSWLLNHIAKTDKALAGFINEKEA